MSPLSPSAVHTGFDVQVHRRPGAVAITHAGRDISYGELDARAQAIAGAIGALGLPRETRVGIYLPRVPDLVATMFAICRAGYCSVPMDPAYPSKRLEFMAADASIAAVVTDAAHAAEAPGRGDVLVVDELGRAPARAAAGPGVLHPRQLSHIIYTSGSTGVPKGVAIDHGGLSVFLGWVRDTFSDRELSGTLASTSVCFDVSTFEIFGTLSWGGRIVLVDNVLAAAWSTKSDRQQFVLARVDRPGGQLSVTLLAPQGSSDLFSVWSANAYVTVPEGTKSLDVGADVAFEWLAPSLGDLQG